ncbi:hypothetical protein LCGC14_1257060 [marine sediment metagenome]|uniref:Uncharacterized protein n=1 Tax=marine sediment metagenome TaxID=412755 RepID=A0A0F9L1Q0_9ZZZZ
MDVKDFGDWGALVDEEEPLERAGKGFIFPDCGYFPSRTPVQPILNSTPLCMKCGREVKSIIRGVDVDGGIFLTLQCHGSEDEIFIPSGTDPRVVVTAFGFRISSRG